MKKKSFRSKPLLKPIHISEEALIAAQSRRCWICGAFMREHREGIRNHPLQMSRDHILPVKHGGSGKRANVLLAHRECNSARNDKLPSGKEALRARYYRIKAIAFQLAISP